MKKTEALHTISLPFDIKLPAPERTMIHSKEELYQKLRESEEDIHSGNTYTADEVFSSLREKYGI